MGTETGMLYRRQKKIDGIVNRVLTVPKVGNKEKHLKRREKWLEKYNANEDLQEIMRQTSLKYLEKITNENADDYLKSKKFADLKNQIFPELVKHLVGLLCQQRSDILTAYGQQVLLPLLQDLQKELNANFTSLFLQDVEGRFKDTYLKMEVSSLSEKDLEKFNLYLRHLILFLSPYNIEIAHNLINSNQNVENSSPSLTKATEIYGPKGTTGNGFGEDTPQASNVFKSIVSVLGKILSRGLLNSGSNKDTTEIVQEIKDLIRDTIIIDPVFDQTESKEDRQEKLAKVIAETYASLKKNTNVQNLKVDLKRFLPYYSDCTFQGFIKVGDSLIPFELQGNNEATLENKNEEHKQYEIRRVLLTNLRNGLITNWANSLLEDENKEKLKIFVQNVVLLDPENEVNIQKTKDKINNSDIPVVWLQRLLHYAYYSYSQGILNIKCRNIINGLFKRSKRKKLKNEARVFMTSLQMSQGIFGKNTMISKRKDAERVKQLSINYLNKKYPELVPDFERDFTLSVYDDPLEELANALKLQSK